MNNNRTLWIVLGVAGVLVICCMGAVLLSGALGLAGLAIFSRSSSPVTGVPQVITAEVVPFESTTTPTRTATAVSTPVETDEPVIEATEPQAEATATPEDAEPQVTPTDGRQLDSGPAEGAGSVGERVEAGPAAVTVLEATNVPDFSGFTPTEGSVYLDLEIELENTSSETLAYSPVNFKVEDEDGSVYDHSWQSVSPALTSGSLEPGQSVRAHLTFEVTGAVGDVVMLRYQPQGPTSSEEAVYIEVEIPQE